MSDKVVEVRLSGMTPGNTQMNVGEMFNIFRITNDMVWCFFRPARFDISSDYVQLISQKHIKIVQNGIGVVYELKYNPKFTYLETYCFTFLPEPVQFDVVEIDLKSDKCLIINNLAVDVLNAAFLADPNAIRALMINRVPCNNVLADDPFVLVHEDPNLNGEHFNVGAIGLINAILIAHGLSPVAVMWEVNEDVNKPNKMVGFCEYIG